MTLQEQYNLIKEGKGDKNFFLKQARNLFPDLVTVHNTFEQTIGILKNKSILSEGVGGIVTNKPKTANDWLKIFEAEVKAVNKETEKELVDLETKNYDYKDTKNIDNLYGQSFLNGFVAEMTDPKNAKKTVDELKDIVAKNMAKDRNYYSKNGVFGIPGLKGEQLEAPKEPKGKYKSSGYGDLSEAKRPNISSEIKEIEKSNEALALEAKIKSIDEAIEKRQSKLSIAESEELAEMIDPKMVKTLQKEIKELEKYKAKAAKLYEKLTGSKKQEVIDEDNDLTQY
jgi:predicted lipid-binding transport protein (Tim44 family)